MVSRISGPIPPHPCYEKLDARSQAYIKVPATGVQRETERATRQGDESLCLALEVEGHAMPSTYKHTSLLFLCFQAKWYSAVEQSAYKLHCFSLKLEDCLVRFYRLCSIVSLPSVL